MTDSLEALRHRADGAVDLQAVVRTMKAMSASSITQYENAVHALDEYYRTVELGLVACLKHPELRLSQMASDAPPVNAVVVVFGTDQGLVGQFNDRLVEFFREKLPTLKGELKIWAVGERVRDQLEDAGLTLQGCFNVPSSVSAITALVAEILVATAEYWETDTANALHLYHHRPGELSGQYQPEVHRLLPLDASWQQNLRQETWPNNNLPETLGNGPATLSALIREYLFVSLYQSCAESLASENASRLVAMQRAEKNIDEMLDELRHAYHHQRQEAIDSELFDVVSSLIE
ncbi:F0F1 ATP synthase subunit gamma [Leucothrix mucor]|uniref:F0F1 ATP synthase subunit gamma n=1 Tax=Leucothrix mucor TaxID=45248 RepID=UPI0003B37DC3|nr:F0F1 ATP synthase subunit gamma [Leucothrix mucor]